MVMKLKGRRISLEELAEGNVDAGAADAVAAGDIETRLEVDTRPDVDLVIAEGDIDDAATDVEAAEDSVDTLVDTGEELAVIRNQISDTLEDEGLDEVSAGLARTAANIALRRVDSELVTPATESFGGSATARMDNTRVTMEAIDGKLRQIWEAVKKALIEAWNAFKAFVKQLVDGKARVKAQAQKLLETIKATSGNAAGGEKIEIKDATLKMIAAQRPLAADWEILVQAVLTAVGKADKLAEQEIAFNNGLAAALQGVKPEAGLDEATRKVLGFLSAYKQAAEAAAAAFKTIGGEAKADIDVPEGFEVVVSNVLPGGYAFYVVAPKEGSDLSLPVILANTKSGITEVEVTGEFSGDVAAVSAESAISLLESVIGAVDALASNKFEELIAAQDKVIKAGDALANKGGEAGPLGALLRSLPRVVRGVAKGSADCEKYSVKLSFAVVEVVRASARTYGKTGTDVAKTSDAAKGTAAEA